MHKFALSKRTLHQYTWQFPMRVSPGIQSGSRWQILPRCVSFTLRSRLKFNKDKTKKQLNSYRMILRWSDTRRDLCYSQYRDGQCSNPTSTAVTKSSCCCCTVILGQPLGWGSTCQPCPLPDTPEFEALCPHGAGMTYNGDGERKREGRNFVKKFLGCYNNFTKFEREIWKVL